MADKILQSINFPGLPDTYIIPNNTDNLAPTEYSPATKAHAVGDIFLLNGVLYRTTSAIAIGDTISSVGMGANVVKTDVADELERDVDISDVRINNTSIVSNTIANIPVANAATAGVVRVNSTYGISSSGGLLYTNPANSNDIKGGNENYKPVVPTTQHESAFYGLAKAAGDTTQAQSSNPVGTYTDDAKAAIKSMLDISESGGSVEPDGYYQQMTVGNAEQLVATVGIEDKVPYNFRTSGGSADIGDREVDKLIGGTVAWNQLIQNGNFMDDVLGWEAENPPYATISASDGILTAKAIQTPTVFYNLGIKNNTLKPYYGHKYLLHAEVYSPVGNVWFGMRSAAFYTGTMVRIVYASQNSWSIGDVIFSCNGSGNDTRPYFAPDTATGFENADEIKWKNICIVDLTQMFGSTIADYIYSLETATAGAGVAFFRKLFPKPYYAYNAGELMHVQTSGHKMVGFNQWDEEREEGSIDPASGQNEELLIGNGWRSKNYIPVISGATYNHFTDGYNGNFTHFWYDANKDFIGTTTPRAVNSNALFTVPEGASFMRIRFLTDLENYKNCINLHWDGERDGEYEPYTTRTYPLDDVVLRGIPKLDANNNLYYDGDEYASDGTVTRRYGVVDLGTLEWSYSSSSGQMYAIISDMVTTNNHAVVCAKYTQVIVTGWAELTVDRTLAVGGGQIRILDTSYTDTTTFTTAVSGVYFVYPLATQTTEEADPYTNPQIVDDWGTEEYIDTRTIPIPVGHDTMYRANLRAKLEMVPDSPDGDGDYIVRQTNGENEYVALNAVRDVKVDNVSVVTNGVANIPITSATGFGLVKYGSGLTIDGSNALTISRASSGDIKGGTNLYKPIVPTNQDAATFYGLAKAAGDSTQSASANAVGTYTESAKSAISSMLSAPETVSGTTPTIAAKAGIQYVCGEVSTIAITTPAMGIVDVIFESGSTPAVLTVTPPTGMTMKWANGFDPTALEANTVYELNIMNGVYGVVASWT